MSLSKGNYTPTGVVPIDGIKRLRHGNYRWLQRKIEITLAVEITGTCRVCDISYSCCHDDVINWKHFPRNWLFVRGSHRSPVNSPHKGQWRGAITSLICVWINGWVNNREAGDLRRSSAHYAVTVMQRHQFDIHPTFCQIVHSATYLEVIRKNNYSFECAKQKWFCTNKWDKCLLWQNMLCNTLFSYYRHWIILSVFVWNFASL